MDALSLTVYDVDGTRIIHAKGEIDMATAPQLAAVLAQCGITSVCVDLTDVTFMDSSGLGVLLRAHKRAAERNVELMIANAAPNVMKVLEITNLDHVLNCEPV